MSDYFTFRASRRILSPVEYDDLFDVTIYADRMKSHFPVPDHIHVYSGLWAAEYYSDSIELIIMHNHEEVRHTCENANSWFRRRLFPNCKKSTENIIVNPESDMYWS